MIEQAYVSIREMCGMVSIPQDSLFMFLKAYFDGSGSFSPKAQDGILTLGGYAGHAEAWDRFEAAWTDILHKYGISHMGYPLDSGNPNILWLGSRGLSVPVGDDRSIRRWVHGDCLLHKAVEEFSPAA